MVKILKTCCCGCSLKSGTVMIAVLGIIGSILIFLLFTFMALIASGEILEELERHATEPEFKKHLADLRKRNFHDLGFEITFSIMAIISGVHVILCILLLYGASAERPSFMQPWIIYEILVMVVMGLFTLVFSIMLMVAGLIAHGVTTLISLVIGILLQIHFILVVYSFCKELSPADIPNNT